MQGDGNTVYDKDNDGKANEVAGCSVLSPHTSRDGQVLTIT
jgi:hypothetical protein